jgi:hypothetical protein
MAAASPGAGSRPKGVGDALADPYSAPPRLPAVTSPFPHQLPCSNQLLHRARARQTVCIHPALSMSIAIRLRHAGRTEQRQAVFLLPQFRRGKRPGVIGAAGPEKWVCRLWRLGRGRGDRRTAAWKGNRRLRCGRRFAGNPEFEAASIRVVLPGRGNLSGACACKKIGAIL